MSGAPADRPVLLLGSTGQVGVELIRAFAGCKLLALDRRAADLSRPESLRAVVREAQPGLILNAGAYTAVDRAEAEPELADAVNHLAPAVLAEEAERAGALLVHYSTDYVFDGSKREPWCETDAPAPLNVYGESKLAGERAIAGRCARYLILRTSWVYGLHGHNFLRTMLRLGREREVLRIVNDQIGAPTSSSALAQATRGIVDRLEQLSSAAPSRSAARNRSAASSRSAARNRSAAPSRSAAPNQGAGLYHATCGGQTSWYGFAEAIFAWAARREPHGAWPRLEGIPSDAYPTPAKRPNNSTLDCGKLQETFAVALPHWQDALADVLASYSPA